MRYNLLFLKAGLLCCLFIQGNTRAQAPSDPLFESDTILTLNLTGYTRKLFNDREDDAKYHPLQLSYKNEENKDVTLHLNAKTRGNFRRKKENCTYPPILLNFQKSDVTNTLFKNQKKVKLVVPCRGDKYIIREYLVYKLYNLVTPKSFRARLVKANFTDADRNETASFYAMLLEEDAQVAKRNGLNLQTKKMMRGEATETETFLKMAVFQYMIGNTDWSVPYLHNIRILAFDSLSVPYTVPYDFDHAGIVGAPYALPPEELELRNTKERRFRGYCLSDMKSFDEVVATYNRLKGDIYKTYTDCALLDEKYITATSKFLDQFYATLNSPKKLAEAFSYPCNKNSPAIVIKGLNKDE